MVSRESILLKGGVSYVRNLELGDWGRGLEEERKLPVFCSFLGDREIVRTLLGVCGIRWFASVGFVIVLVDVAGQGDADGAVLFMLRKLMGRRNIYMTRLSSSVHVSRVTGESHGYWCVGIVFRLPSARATSSEGELAVGEIESTDYNLAGFYRCIENNDFSISVSVMLIRAIRSVNLRLPLLSQILL